MRLMMKSGDRLCNIRVDEIERKGDVIFAYRKPEGSMVATEFAGCFDLGSVDFLYITDERRSE